jgi:acyl-coenzyme A thioesterase PaaI-like protein
MRNDTTLLHDLTEGHLHAAARARHRGADRWVWEVETHDEAGLLCALSIVTIAVRPPR